MKTPEFIFNTFEAGAWFLFSGIFVVCTVKAKNERRWLSGVASAAFFVFGVSDIIESRTGAWWTPWWLLTVKALCVLVFIYLHLTYRRLIKVEAQADAEG